ncbi:palmitoyltransferase [Marchantia polymorpha subsp. ruderalis]|uniref:S-acyltransferase n=2 Tax=Marchantia polymorpha TaxID=3197 RepID=A0AAF6BF72_MARPO|nr:hypothetical protein MARPO_0027s0090 [Marchantia polymorpha]BBN10656.1 hypothetical protein Mp_5g05360 [Marchantia polymorpha subsp. ruderalis]|eukprot:PTQ42978.1 hypothetical protein MARPO_0027s0090 [Marchantia polymorpha]
MAINSAGWVGDDKKQTQKTVMAKRVYQVWKGSNRFFLCGRLIFGPDVRSLVVTVFLIVVPAVVFCVFVARKLIDKFENNSGIAILVAAVVFTSIVLVLLLLTSGRDPGIIPRNAHPPEPDEDYDAANSPAEWGGGQTPRLRLPRTKDVIVNGVAVKTKYCETCMLYRPPRCSHCSICNNCVERFDHHCPWVGQCIGQRNYRFFFMFVSFTTMLCIYVFAMCAVYIKFLMDGEEKTVWKALSKSPASVVLMVYTFIAVWFVGGLTLFHLYLISTNQTTYENFRYRYDNKVNPYNQGVMNNFREIFCTRVVPSKNKFRARVKQDSLGQNPMSAPSGESAEMHGTSVSKGGGDLEMGSKATWQIGGEHGIGPESAEDLHARISTGSELGLESKDGFDENFPLDRNLAGDGETRTTHPRRSSWGRKSGSWEITPDILALAQGAGAEGSRVNGDSTPPGNR